MSQVVVASGSTPVVDRQKPQKRIKRTKEDAKDAKEVLEGALEYVLRSALARCTKSEPPMTLKNAVSWFEGLEIEARIVRYEWIFDKGVWRKSNCTLPESDLDPLIEGLKLRTESKPWEYSRDVYFDPAGLLEDRTSNEPNPANERLASRFVEGRKAHPYIETAFRQTTTYSPDDFGSSNALGVKRKVAQIDLKPWAEPIIGSSKKKSLEEKHKQTEQDDEYHRESDYSKIETISGRSVYGVRLCASLEWQTGSEEEFADLASRIVDRPRTDQSNAKKKRSPGFEATRRVRCKVRKSFVRPEGTRTRYDLTYCVESETMSGCEKRCKNFFENCENRRKRKRVSHVWEDVKPTAEFEIEFDMANLTSEAIRILKEDKDLEDDEESRELVLRKIVDLMARDVEDIVVSYYGLERCNELGL